MTNQRFADPVSGLFTGTTVHHTDEGAYTVLALALDVAMACDDSARERYRALHGVEWVPLCERQDGTPVVTTTNTSATVVGKR